MRGVNAIRVCVCDCRCRKVSTVPLASKRIVIAVTFGRIKLFRMQAGRQAGKEGIGLDWIGLDRGQRCKGVDCPRSSMEAFKATNTKERDQTGSLSLSLFSSSFLY